MHPHLTRLPSLVALRAFVVLGETLNIRRTGEILHTDHASISRHISRLEATLGVALFEKKKRRLELTADGEAYFRKVKRIFDALCDATADLRAKHPRLLSVLATPGLAHERLLPALPKLAEALAGWRINLLTGMDGRIEPAAGPEIRVHIRFGALAALPDDHIQVRIAEPRLFPVASPAFLARHPAVTSVETMLRLPILYSEETGVWDQWTRRAGGQPLLPTRGIEIPNTHLALQAAVLGQGIALANSILARDAIARGDLIELLDTAVFVDAYYLVCARKDWDHSPLLELRRWLEAELDLPAPLRPE